MMVREDPPIEGPAAQHTPDLVGPAIRDQVALNTAAQEDLPTQVLEVRDTTAQEDLLTMVLVDQLTRVPEAHVTVDRAAPVTPARAEALAAQACVAKFYTENRATDMQWSRGLFRAWVIVSVGVGSVCRGLDGI
jgi:hypothetical protein